MGLRVAEFPADENRPGDPRLRAFLPERFSMIVKGTVIHTPVLGRVEIISDALVTVDNDGQIGSVLGTDSSEYETCFAAARTDSHFVELQRGQYLLPGLVDLHVHAPQWPQLGKALHLPLYDWLQQYTFPLEARYSDLGFARTVYTSLVDNLLANGTTTATYFGTIHLEATKILADICQEQGQRAIIGKVVMDNSDECPDFYRDDSCRSSLDETSTFVEYVNGIGGKDSGRVLPAVTPRFIPSCTDEALMGLGKIAREYGCHVQTHCSESDWEHNYVLDRHGINDTQSLDRFGLLTDKTVLAHSNLISRSDMTTVRDRDCGIAHCPLSNVYFSNAVFPARRALDFGLTVGLGTDISGGPRADILSNCQAAVNASRLLEEGVDADADAARRGTPDSRIDYLEAFWMATVGGARALDLKIGQISDGYCFDAIVVDTESPDSNLKTWDGMDTAEDILQKIIYNADRRNIARVWVQGKLLKSS
ncbi:MAG: guanine deaminase [Woeseiaceae bacterium]